MKLYNEINKENLIVLMTNFYEKVATNEVLAPYFFEELGDDLKNSDWIEHIELLADFWFAKILGQDTYYGNFIGAHAKMRHIKKDDYYIWFELFSEASNETYTPEVSALFKKKAFQFVKQFLHTDLKI